VLPAQTAEKIFTRVVRFSAESAADDHNVQRQYFANSAKMYLQTRSAISGLNTNWSNHLV